MFYSAHINIFQFIDILKNVQKEIHIKQRNIHITKNRQMIVYKKVYFKQNIVKYESG
jgi:hypothetical protein